MARRRQSPIFVRTYDLLLWLIPRLLDFPRSQRGVMARQLRIQAFALYDVLVEAAMCPAGDDPLPELRRADAELTKLRTYVRLSHELELFSAGQYEHAARMLVEIGRLLGGWIKKVTDDRMTHNE
jgi:hypothetical protein